MIPFPQYAGLAGDALLPPTTPVPVEEGATPVPVGVVATPVPDGVVPAPVPDGVVPAPTVIVPFIPLAKWIPQKKFRVPDCVKGPCVKTQEGEPQKGGVTASLMFIPRAAPWVPVIEFARLDADSIV